MKRPPRPGEKIWVRSRPGFTGLGPLFEATVWCHAGPELIRFAFRNINDVLLRPNRYGAPMYLGQCVRRSEEGVTWWRAADADAVRAVEILVASAR